MCNYVDVRPLTAEPPLLECRVLSLFDLHVYNAKSKIVYNVSLTGICSTLKIFLSNVVVERPLCLDRMFGNSRYFGLRGTKLNVAVGVLAGLDFL